MKTSDKWLVTGDKRLRISHSAARHASRITHYTSAFTLIELLVVITILGILAGLAVPALKNISKSDANTSAARQMLDDIGRARQMAISRHTTVYLVLVPTNFFNLPCSYNGTPYPNLPAGINAMPPGSDRQTGLTTMTTAMATKAPAASFLA